MIVSIAPSRSWPANLRKAIQKYSNKINLFQSRHREAGQRTRKLADEQAEIYTRFNRAIAKLASEPEFRERLEKYLDVVGFNRAIAKLASEPEWDKVVCCARPLFSFNRAIAKLASEPGQCAGIPR